MWLCNYITQPTPPSCSWVWLPSRGLTLFEDCFNVETLSRCSSAFCFVMNFYSSTLALPFAHKQTHTRTPAHIQIFVALQICQPSFFLIFFTFSSSNNTSGVQCCDQAGLLHGTTSQDELSSHACQSQEN